MPVGLTGLLNMRSFVLGVMHLQIFSAVRRKFGYVSTKTGLPPQTFTRCLYNTKYGSGTRTSSPGFTRASSERKSPPDAPPVIIILSALILYFFVRVAFNLLCSSG